jgi:glutaredoxin
MKIHHTRCIDVFFEATMRRPVRAAPAVALLLSTLLGCDAILSWTTERWNERFADASEATEPSAMPGDGESEIAESDLPERPAGSIAHSAEGVSRFAAILEDETMTREERIRAFENLDPAALQAPAKPNVVGGSSPAQSQVQHSEPRAPKDWEIANARKRVPIVVFSTSWCGVCKRAKAYFEQEGIAFVEHDVDENQAARAEYLALNPKRTVPTIKIGNEVVIGFSEQAVQGAIDAAARARLR